jgi:GrpB-like predicted nucleotidyltransferase (UPF0157 family)
VYLPDPESLAYRMVARPSRRPRTHHLHVCGIGSDQEHRHLAVRDFLRAHDDEAAAYAALKREVASSHPEDGLAYIEAKDAYVAALERRALGWARRRPQPS